MINTQEKWDKPLYQLSSIIGYQISFLQNIIFNKHRHYKPKSIPKKKGAPRILNIPDDKLKSIQRRILSNFLELGIPSVDSHGFILNRSIVTNATKHVGKKVVLKIDLKDFFHSIKKESVYQLFVSRGISEQVSKYLAELCTFNDCLPQGAPTSPAISNLICRNLDKRLHYLARNANVGYSRYADDLTFSGNEITRPFSSLVAQIVVDEGLCVNPDKIVLVKQHRSQIVTGVVVNKKLSYGRKRYKKLLGLIHSCQVGNIEDQRLRASYSGYRIKDIKLFLEGTISHIYSIDPQKAIKLRTELTKITDEKWREYRRDSSVTLRNDLLINILRTIKRINGRFNGDFFPDKTYKIVPSGDSFPDIQSVSTYCIDFADYIKRLNLSLLSVQQNGDATLNSLSSWLASGSNQNDAENIIEVFRDINTLSKSIARHEDKTSVLKVLSKYRFRLNSRSFDRLIDILLKRVWISLLRIDAIFQERIY